MTLEGRVGEEQDPPTRNVPAAVEVDLRPKNQMTLPASVAQLFGLAPGDRLLLHVEDGEIRLRPIRASYAGALAGVYGTSDEAASELRREREAWER